MAKITLKLEKRDLLGKKVKKLRRQGIIPANVFGKDVKSMSISAKLNEFQKIFDEAGETQIVYLQIEGEEKERPTLITNVQYHPVTDEVLHVDFRQVDLKEKITANIPIELTGEAPAVKDLNAVVVAAISEIEVEALPTDFLEKIEVDISGLKEIGDTIKVSDLKIDRTKIEVLTDPETIVVTATPQQAEEVAPAPAPTEEAPSIPAEGAPAPAEGEAKPPTESKPE